MKVAIKESIYLTCWLNWFNDPLAELMVHCWGLLRSLLGEESPT